MWPKDISCLDQAPRSCFHFHLNIKFFICLLVFLFFSTAQTRVHIFHPFFINICLFIPVLNVPPTCSIFSSLSIDETNFFTEKGNAVDCGCMICRDSFRLTERARGPNVRPMKLQIKNPGPSALHPHFVYCCYCLRLEPSLNIHPMF